MSRKKPGRRSIRLDDYDYTAPGAYFITVCSHQRKPIFGAIAEGQVILSSIGRIVESEWLRTERIRAEIALDEFVIMPNHIHGIVAIRRSGGRTEKVGAHGHAPLRRPPRSLGSMVARFKGAVTRAVRRRLSNTEYIVWQRGYYDRVIRDKRELEAIRRYIHNNPMRWELDRHFASREA